MQTPTVKGCEIHSHASKHGSSRKQGLSEALLALSALAEGTGCRIKGGRERHGKEGKGRNVEDSESTESKEL